MLIDKIWEFEFHGDNVLMVTDWGALVFNMDELLKAEPERTGFGERIIVKYGKTEAEILASEFEKVKKEYLKRLEL